MEMESSNQGEEPTIQKSQENGGRERLHRASMLIVLVLISAVAAWLLISSQNSSLSAEVTRPSLVGGRTAATAVAEVPVPLRFSGPLIGYHKTIQGANQVYGLHCQQPDCSSATIFTPGPGSFTAATLPADHLPFLVYTNDVYPQINLKSTKCLDYFCNNQTSTILDNATISPNKSVAHFRDGSPAIAYQTIQPSQNREFTLLLCGNPSCTVANRKLLIDTQGGYHNSIAIGNDGAPVIAYWKQSPVNQLKMAKCSDSNCTNMSFSVIDWNQSDANTTVYSNPSIAVSPISGFPTISYTKGNTIKVAACTDGNCSSPAIRNLTLGSRSSITFTADGNAVISYYDYNGTALRVAKCAGPTCSQSSIVTTVEAGPGASYFSSITTTNGQPFVAYSSYPTASLKSVYCRNLSCTSFDAPRIQDSGISFSIVTTDG